MSDDRPTAQQLRKLLIELLAGATGRSKLDWELPIGLITVVPVWSNPICNWRVVSHGSESDKYDIAKAVEVVRAQHPYAVR